jgi:SM-20-related protein
MIPTSQTTAPARDVITDRTSTIASSPRSRSILRNKTRLSAPTSSAGQDHAPLDEQAAGARRHRTRRRRTARRDVRGDRIRWFDDAADARAEQSPFEALAAARRGQRELTLGLSAFEGHYALYPAGARYARHRDRFRDDDARVLSIVLYLNASWRKADGGALRIHVTDELMHDVMPRGGTLVVFQSDRFEHEVLPAARERLSIAGWFRRRA